MPLRSSLINLMHCWIKVLISLVMALFVGVNVLNVVLEKYTKYKERFYWWLNIQDVIGIAGKKFPEVGKHHRRHRHTHTHWRKRLQLPFSHMWITTFCRKNTFSLTHTHTHTHTQMTRDHSIFSPHVFFCLIMQVILVHDSFGLKIYFLCPLYMMGDYTSTVHVHLYRTYTHPPPKKTIHTHRTLSNWAPPLSVTS